MSAFLHKTRRVFYHRSGIPRRLRRLLNGRSEIWRSLGTTDKDKATARSAQWNARVQRLLVTLRKHGEKMTKEERELLVSRWLESSLEEAEDYRAICGPVPDSDRETKQMILSDLWEEANEALVSCDYRKIEKEADELLKSAGLPPLDHEGAEFGRLCRRLLQVKQEYFRIESSRWDGDYSYVLPALSSSSSASSGHPMAKQKMRSKVFNEVVTLYFKENARAERTDAQVKAELDRFIESLGEERGIESITKEDCRTYKEALQNTRKLGPATVINHLSNLSSIFKWSEAQGFIPENTNPVRGLAPTKKAAKKAAQDRRPFTNEELLQVFGSKEFLNQRGSNPARYWLPLICLYQVTRREEAGQLAVCDIHEEGGVPYLRINDDEKLGQSLKNEGSRRRVPIHSSLVQLGFLEYVKSVKSAGHARLFPSLTRGANGYSDPVGKWFGRLLRSVGIDTLRSSCIVRGTLASLD